MDDALTTNPLAGVDFNGVRDACEDGAGGTQLAGDDVDSGPVRSSIPQRR